ncbi:MAG TPA: glycosyltransferase family 9 protein [Bdellovibrio sp.]|uniref:glycosyltransferase family 9 protein n=1 Tax=Bdellovibrio sp. TaxID=28201 RepID=UPI002F09D70E
MTMPYKKILVIKTRAIGDTVIWTSALAKLRKAYPDAEIHALTYSMNRDILLHSQFINQLHLVDHKSKWAFVKKLAELRKEKFDLLLGFHVSGTLCKFAWLVGAPEVVLHHHSMHKTPWLSTKEVAMPGNLEDAITRDYRVLEAIGIPQEPHELTKIDLLPEEVAFAQKLTHEKIMEAGGNPEKKRFIFLPGASYSLKIYPKDLWTQVVKKIRDEGEYQPLVLCDAKLSKEWHLPELCKELGVPLIDNVTLRQFISLISTGSVTLSNDSSPGHISVALGVRTHFLFGPACIGDWFCYDRRLHTYHRVDVPCRIEGPRDREQFQFCTVTSCSHHSCMRKIDLLQIKHW